MSSLTIVIPIYLSHPLHLEFTQETIKSIKTKHSHQILVIVNHTQPEFTHDLKLLAKDKHTTVAPNPKGNILAAAWNLGISQAFDKPDKLSKSGLSPAKATGSGNGRIGSLRESAIASAGHQQLNSNKPSDYCLIVNNDLIFHPQCIDNLIDFAQSHPQFLLYSATEWPDQRTINQAKWDGSCGEHPHFSCFMLTPKTVKTIGYFDENFHLGYFEDNDYHTRLLLSGYKAASTTTAKFYHYGSRTINIDDQLRVKGKYHYQKNRAYFKKKWGIDIHGQGFSPPEKILEKIYPHPFNKPSMTLKDW